MMNSQQEIEHLKSSVKEIFKECGDWDRGSTATGYYCLIIGANNCANHNYSIIIGNGLSTTANYQVLVDDFDNVVMDWKNTGIVAGTRDSIMKIRAKHQAVNNQAGLEIIDKILSVL